LLSVGELIRRHVQHALLITAAVTALASIASAADLPARAPVYKAAPVVVAPSWTGFYVGVTAGYAWAHDNSVNSVGTPVFANPLSQPGSGVSLANAVTGVTTGIPGSKANGFIGGGQFGYNYQFNNIVVGIETDIQGLSGRGSGATANSVQLLPGFAGNFVNSGLTATNSVNWLGTLRGRLGFTITPSLLVYGTGGLAYGGVSSSTTIGQVLTGPAATGVNGPYGSSASISQTRAGWALGAGGEWMFTRNWSAKIEYLHYDLGSVSYGSTLSNIVVPPGGVIPVGSTFYTLGAASSTHFGGDIVRVGVNYKF
jgi:outer membrane immunogenic protein